MLGLDVSPGGAARRADFEESGLPSALRAFAPVGLPLALIFASTVLAALGPGGAWVDAVLFLGSPVIAVAIGLVLALYSVGSRMSHKEVLRAMEGGMKSAGVKNERVSGASSQKSTSITTPPAVPRIRDRPA